MIVGELAEMVGLIVAIGVVGVGLGTLIAEVKGIRRDLQTSLAEHRGRIDALDGRVVELERRPCCSGLTAVGNETGR